MAKVVAAAIGSEGRWHAPDPRETDHLMLQRNIILPAPPVHYITFVSISSGVTNLRSGIFPDCLAPRFCYLGPRQKPDHSHTVYA